MAYRRTPAVQDRLDATREGVLDAARALVAGNGYAGVSIAAVARRAGVATGTVYRHFADKSALLGEVFDRAAAREVGAVRAAADTDAAPAERLRAFVTTFAERAVRSQQLAWALLAEPVDPGIEARRWVFRRAFRDVLAEVIADGVAAGVFAEQRPQRSAAAADGAIAEALVGPLGTGTADEDDVRALVALALRAVGGRDGYDARGEQPGRAAGRP